MEGSTRDFSPPYSQPSSPPATPGTHSDSRFPSTAIHSPPMYKKMGLSVLAQSPPLEFIEPIGDGPQFHFTRPQSSDIISHRSSISGEAAVVDALQSDDEEDSDGETYDTERDTSSRFIEEESFTLEELSDGDYGDSEIIEVVQPDCCEEADSEKGAPEIVEPETGIVGDFERLNCADKLDDEEQRLRYERKKKRWSRGNYGKRSHSQSIGSDTDDDDAEDLDAHDVGSSARRLRRRVRGPGGGPGDRSSLIFDEIPHLNIAEVDETDDMPSMEEPPALGSDTEEFTLHALPFWESERMDMDGDSDGSSSV